MTTPAAPPPLTPPHCDLRGLDYMPFFGNHLLGSSFNAAASDAEWRAGITLYWAAWNQVPAGSLPDDDVALCRLADMGRDLKGWAPLRAHALHGFVLCSDGRLYHPFLCAQVLIAWDKRAAERRRKALWRELKSNKGRGQDGDATGTGRGRDADVPSDGTGRPVPTGRDVPYRHSASARNGTTGPEAPPSRPATAAGKTKQPKSKSKTEQPPTGEKQQPGPAEAWRSTVDGIRAKGEALGFGRYDGRGDWDEYKKRVFNATRAPAAPAAGARGARP